MKKTTITNATKMAIEGAISHEFTSIAISNGTHEQMADLNDKGKINPIAEKITTDEVLQQCDQVIKDFQKKNGVTPDGDAEHMPTPTGTMVDDFQSALSKVTKPIALQIYNEAAKLITSGKKSNKKAA